MKEYKLDLKTKINGIYLSAETIDLMSIIQCSTIEELKDFIQNCEQIDSNQVDLRQENLEELKKQIYKQYQDDLISIEESTVDRESVLKKTLLHSGIKENELDNYIKAYKEKDISGIKEVLQTKRPDEYEKIAKSQHRYMISERDQIKSVPYEEMSVLTKLLKEHNTVLLGNARYYDVVNSFSDDKHPNLEKYDFYHIKRGLDFCKKNGLQARYHTLLDKETLDKHIAGNDKKTVLKNLNEYVKNSIDFINKYNKENGDVIKSVDLFNEIISFEPPYINRWEQEYGISTQELIECFKYAAENKPNEVTYVYNEPFLENKQRRNSVISLLEKMKKLSPNLIDTLGSQMHLETSQDITEIKNCFEDFNKLQKEGFNIQITEFDMCLPEKEIFNKDGTLRKITGDNKKEKISEIVDTIKKSEVKLEGVTYWSISDTLDHNLERTNKKTFLVKDFYKKYQTSKENKSDVKFEELLKHPVFKNNEQKERFKKLYNSNGGTDKLEYMLKSIQREEVKSRLSGLYSDLEIKKEEKMSLFNEAIEETKKITRTSQVDFQKKEMKEPQKVQEKTLGEK